MTPPFRWVWSGLLIAGVTLWSGFLPAAGTEDTASGNEFFERHIRPTLIHRCDECHSTGAKKLKGGLLLDSRAGWSRGGDSGPAVVPGDPDGSLLIQAVLWDDENLQMPPKNRLPQAEIDALVTWVKLGAPDPREDRAGAASIATVSPLHRTNHWSYQSVARVTPPEVRDTAWPQGDIDRFILAGLEERGLSPAPDATAAALCRRITFDLTGLPPTPDELEAFTRAATIDGPFATAALVERLIASPQFGEQWARHWFDVVRYGESVTLRGLIFREAWRYRDYVIDSLNRDVPLDQLIREHIAGDLLPYRDVGEHQRQVTATTFLTLGNWNLEEQDKQQLDMDVVDEQLDTIGKAFLGQTLGCARCHDHKFDPIPTREYYAMAGILKNSRTLKHANVSEWLEVPLPLEAEEEERFTRHEAELVALHAGIRAARDAAGQTADAGVVAAVISAGDLPGVVVDSSEARRVGQWRHSQYSKHYVGDGYWHDDDSGKGEKTLSFTPSLPRSGRYEVRLAYVPAGNRATNCAVTLFHADGETTVHVNQQEAPALDGRFVSLGQFDFEANGFGYVLVSNEGTRGYVTADAVQFLPIETVGVGIRPQAGDSGPDRDLATPDAVRAQETIKSLEARLKSLKASGPKRPMVMTVLEVDQPQDIPIHVRGSVHTLGPIVPRGFLSVASRGTTPSIPDDASGRRQLADWIASPDNPLTARVLVNRVWLWLMGEGLVRTPDNFGTTGDRPTHPGLLDHLASRFVEEGWSLKRLVREVMRSRTYQLSSTAPALAASLDPENRLLGSARRRRLTAEQLRDAMLAISGQLKLGNAGPTYPADRTADFGFVFDEPLRSVYAPVFRNALPEIFEAFDFAPTSMVTGRRHVSTVPTQALFLLNHPFVREQARAAAVRWMALNRADDDSRIDRAYELSLGRLPSPGERSLALRHLTQDSVGSAEGAWTELFHALFASMDFRYLE